MTIASGASWHDAGTGTWDGTPATVWEVNYLLPDHALSHEPIGVLFSLSHGVWLPEAPTYAHETIYLDAATDLPLAQVVEFDPPAGGAGSGFTVEYGFSFVPPGEAQKAFDLENLRAQTLAYGDYADIQREDLGQVPRLSLGRTVTIDGYPALTLVESFRSYDRPQFILSYQVANPIPHDGLERFGMVALTITPTTDDSTGPPVGAEQITVAGMAGDLVVRPGSPATATIWLRGAVVSVEAGPLTSVPLASTYVFGAQPLPNDGMDRNEFNDERAIRALLKQLEVVR